MNILNAPQRTEAWYEARKGMPTCSRFDMILTPSTGKPSSSQDKLINQLIAESILPPAEGFLKSAYTSPEMEQGVILEAEARCRYELEYADSPVSEVGFITHESGLFGGSPDALVGDHGGVEIKCPKAETHIGYVRAGTLPSEYKCQVHGYMVVTGRTYWDFFSYARHFPPFLLRVNRDEFTEKLEYAVRSFCIAYQAERARFLSNQSK